MRQGHIWKNKSFKQSQRLTKAIEQKYAEITTSHKHTQYHSHLHTKKDQNLQKISSKTKVLKNEKISFFT